MTTFDCLPFDVIDYILNCDCISYIDVCRLSSVSKIFNCVAKSNKLWKKKYSQEWPELACLFEAQDTDWHHEFRLKTDFKKLVSQKLSELSAEYYHSENVSNEAFLYFKDISKDHVLGYEIVIDELENIVNDENCNINLTKKYYAVRALRYMRHAQLEKIWKSYLSQSSDKLSLIEGACLISQWCQPSISKCTSHVSAEIQEITETVFEKIKHLFPQHPIVKQGIRKEDAISSSLWSPRQCKDIIYCINAVMFQDMKFTGSPIDYYSASATFIEKVLAKRTGISITLGIVYATIAAKLGVCCLPVNFPGHFLLKWLEHPGLREKEMYTFIDAVDKGALKSYCDLSELAPGFQTFSSSWVESVTPLKVFIRLAWYLVEFGRQMEGMGQDSLSLCNALELLCLLSPDDMEHKLLLARLFMHLGINITEAISMLQEIAAHDPSSPLTIGYLYQSTLHTLETQRISRPLVKTKLQMRDETSNVKFAVGMIMRHIKYKFRCVIYGWDYTCSASKDWIKRMGVHKLSFKDKQPFYYVLVDDGTNRYAAQENLAIDHENKQIPHIKIGRYFESFYGNYYFPNEQTLSEYPDDVAVLRENAIDCK